MHIPGMIQHRELPVLNGRRVNVRHLELAPNAINDETSKKLVFIVYYENHNYRIYPTEAQKELLTKTFVVDILPNGEIRDITEEELAKSLDHKIRSQEHDGSINNIFFDYARLLFDIGC